VAGAPIDFETVLLDPTTDNYDDLYSAIQSVKRNGCGIKGNIETKINRPDIKSRNVEMRNALDLFVNRVMCKSQPGIKTRHEDIDIVVSMRNRMVPSSVVQCMFLDLPDPDNYIIKPK
jgi:isocitrate dehydrogenase (NAD+)